MLQLHSYFRSSSAYRVRIALNLKQLAYEVLPVHLLRDGGQQHSGGFAATNPARLVPVLQHDTLTLTQSVAIMEYLEETWPVPALLPRDPLERAWVRGLALDVICDIQPLNNLRVLKRLEEEFGLEEPARLQWSHEWIRRGFTAVEARLAAREPARYCFGSTATLADCCLIPQVFNALRINAPLAPFANIMRIYETCMAEEAFRAAAPGRQVDAE